MDNFYSQFHFIHTLLPYFPRETRMLFLYLLYFMEIRQMFDEFRAEEDFLQASPDRDKFPDMNEIMEMLTNELPKGEAEHVKRMVEMMKMMENMDFTSIFPEKETEYENTHDNRSASTGKSGGISPDLLKRMLSPKQHEMFDRYKNLFRE